MVNKGKIKALYRAKSCKTPGFMPQTRKFFWTTPQKVAKICFLVE
jgi:hypothetical protein